jgi:hypothetical protein
MKISDYNKRKEKEDIIIYEKEYLQNLIDEEALDGIIIDDPWTTNRGRLHLLIDY